MIKTEGPHNGMGLQKIESFFSDIFGCGGGCNFSGHEGSDASYRSHSSRRDSALQEHDFYASHFSKSNLDKHNKHNIKGINLCGGPAGIIHHKDQRWNCTSKEIMIACDEENDENSVLNETGTTHSNSFFLDDSSLSLPSSIAFHERPMPRAPLQALQEPPMLLPERKPTMVPTERSVGVWPPMIPMRLQQEEIIVGRPQERQRRRFGGPQRGPQTLPPQPFAPPQQERQEFPLPLRPPKIRRLTLDDVLLMDPHPIDDLEGNGSRRFDIHDDDEDDDDDILPRVPESVFRSRSLDFLFSSRRHMPRKEKPKRKEHHNSHHQQHHSSRNAHIRYCEEERTRLQLLEMLSDLNETYTTI